MVKEKKVLNVMKSNSLKNKDTKLAPSKSGLTDKFVNNLQTVMSRISK